MEAAAEEMKAQLELWSLRLDELAAKTEAAGARAGFAALTHIDELKALRAIAQSKLDAYMAAGDAERAGLKAEMQCAGTELAAALKNSRPPGDNSRKRGYSS